MEAATFADRIFFFWVVACFLLISRRNEHFAEQSTQHLQDITLSYYFFCLLKWFVRSNPIRDKVCFDKAITQRRSLYIYSRFWKDLYKCI